MEEQLPTCRHCDVKMESGFVLDYGGAMESHWQPGYPEPRRILGIIVGGFKVDHEKQLKVTTYHCPNCGYLESYARKSMNS